ncbi:MAG: hypothetical protein COT73_01470 [Bdellovibrio sp. CG10_big_fil_rev_8_21_14_0_10_47_8]|nr:MAG: hypothetical protein COT73_01470 [Bdellovibrio sp. CG10_big_fil_rev_8_21_14_0_10_47_8]
MKYLRQSMLIFLGSLLGMTSVSLAAPSKGKNADAPKAAHQTQQTEHNFEDLLVQGKYHFSDEAVTTVEDDKVLDSLIGVRNDFKDRLKESSGMY